MASKIMYFSRSSSGYNAEDGDYIDYTPDSSISFGSGYKCTHFYFNVDGGLTSASSSGRYHGANLQVKSNGTWYEIWSDGELWLPAKGTTGYDFGFNGAIPSNVQATLGTYGITDLRLQQEENIDGYSYALRDTTGSGTLEIEYTVPQPEVTDPTISSITQNNDGTFTIKWGACTGSNGSGSVTYGVYDDTAGGYLNQSVSGTSYTGNIPAYGTTRQYSVIAYYSGISSNWSGIVSKTFTKPSLNAPTNLKINSSTSYTGATAPLTWTQGAFNYTSGTRTYEIYKGSTLVHTTGTSATSYIIPESTTKGWGTSAVTLKIRGKGTSLGNTASGSTIYSSYTSTVSYTYLASVSTHPSGLKVNGQTSYTGATAPLTWTAAAFSGGQTPTYSIRVNGTQLTTTTSTSYTIPESTTKSYTSVVTITVVAIGGGATSNATNEVTYTYSPTLIGPSNLKINEAASYIGQTAILTWTEASLSNGGSIIYSIRKDGIEFATTINTTYTITEDVAKTWGTSAISLTIVAIGEGKTSSASNTVTFTYKSAYKTINYYNGASWVKCIVYYHNGTNWIQTEVHYHNGSTWNTINS